MSLRLPVVDLVPPPDADLQVTLSGIGSTFFRVNHLRTLHPFCESAKPLSVGDSESQISWAGQRLAVVQRYAWRSAGRMLKPLTVCLY